MDLKKDNDPCMIGECVKSLKGLPSNSASTTDIFVVHFKDGTKYDDKEIHNAFMKIFISPDNLHDFKSQRESKGLRYELEIYNDIIKTLLDYNICPNYVRCYATTKNCSYYNIVKILENKIENYEDAIIRSYFYMSTGRDKRPAIDKESDKKLPITDEIRENAKNSLYDFIINESLHDVVTLFEFLQIEKDTEVLYPIMFQIFCACYGLVLMNTNHGDLHSGNIFIQHVDTMTLHYNINGTIYSVKTNYIVKIFDYDRTYCKNLGDNPLLERNKINCGYTNNFVPIKDVWQIVFWCKSYLPDLLSIIAKDEKDVDIFKNFIRAYHFRFNDGKYMTIEDIENYTCSIEDVLYRTAEKANLKNDYIDGPIYILKRELFNDGVLNIGLLTDSELHEFDIITSNRDYTKHDYRQLYNVLEQSNSHKFSL